MILNPTGPRDFSKLMPGREKESHEPLAHSIPTDNLERLISNHIKSAVERTNGKVYATREFEGIAALIPSTRLSDKKPFSALQPRQTANILRTQICAIKLFLRSRNVSWYKRMKHVGPCYRQLESQYAPKCYWELVMIGVNPDLQGRGYAAALLREMIGWLDEEQCDCYLHTASAENVPIYRHFGFRVLGSCSVPGTSITATGNGKVKT